MKKVDKKAVSEALDNLSHEEAKALAKAIEGGELNEVDEKDVDGTKGMDGNYRTNMMSIAMKSLAGMENDQIAFFLKSLEQVGHEADAIPAGAASQNQASIKMKGSPDTISTMHESLKAALKEDLSTVFGDDKDLSEEFKEKITTLFEAAVSYRVTAAEEMLVEAYAKKLDEEVQHLTEELIGKVDEYVSYVAEEWLKENQVAVEQSLNAELADSFMADLKALFDKHYISVPEDKIDVADALAAKVDELEATLNKTLEDNIQLAEMFKTAEKDKLISEYTTGMTLAQGDKFRQLMESVDYEGDNDEFKKKMDIVKDSHFKSGKTVGKTNIITEEITYSPHEKAEAPEEDKTLDPTMRDYMKALSRTIRH